MDKRKKALECKLAASHVKSFTNTTTVCTCFLKSVKDSYQ